MNKEDVKDLETWKQWVLELIEREGKYNHINNPKSIQKIGKAWTEGHPSGLCQEHAIYDVVYLVLSLEKANGFIDEFIHHENHGETPPGGER